MRHPEHKSWCAVAHGYNTCTCALATESDACPTCGQSTKTAPKHEAQQPHEATMIGRR